MCKKIKIGAEIILLGVVVIWGYTFPVIKNILNIIPPFTFLTYRFFLAFSIIYLLFRNHLKRIDLLTISKGLLIGFFLFIGYFGQTLGTQFTTATKTAFITGISVILVPIIAFFWIQEKLHRNSVIGVILAMIGLWLMNSNGTLYHINLGDSLVFLGAVGFALYIIAVDIYTKKLDYVQLVFIQLITVFLLSFFMAILYEKEALNFSYTSSVWWAVVINGVFATALAFYLQNRFQQYSTPTKIAIIFSAEPVFGAIFSYLLLGETIGIFGLLGGIAIFSGMFIAQIEKTEKI
jgi:drug/metabolite transporter (DMT)-like permease